MIRTLFALLPPDARGTVRRFAALSVLSVIVRAVGVVTLVPLISALVDGDNGRAGAWLGALTLATVGGWLIESAAARLAFELGFGVLNNAQHSVAERLSRIELTWFGAANTASARQAIATTGPDLVGVFVYLVIPVVGAILVPVAIGVVLFFVAWQLAVVALVCVPLLLGALWGTGAISRRADAIADAQNARLSERLVEFARTQAALRVSRRVEPRRSLVGDALTGQHRATARLLLLQLPGQILFSVASQVSLFALAGVTAWLTVRGDLSAAAAVALIVVLVRYLEPFTVLGELAPGLEATRLALQRIGTVIGGPVPEPGPERGIVSGAPRIEFDGVCFDYGDPEDPVLREVDLVLEPGSATAIVGPSGSGKSTVVGLIAGLYRPTAGRILVDGVDVAALDQQSRRALASVVFQEPYLMTGSIEENIAAGDPAADPRAIAEAARLARVTEITDRLPDGAAAQVGEGGVALSGGERQRVSILRALLKPAPVLLIDEATSALDNENERAVVDALAAGDRPRTRVVVAHRRAGIRHADQVLFLDGGRIVESGTPEQLLAAGGRFAEFWRHQGDGAAWTLTGTVGQGTAG